MPRRGPSDLPGDPSPPSSVRRAGPGVWAGVVAAAAVAVLAAVTTAARSPATVVVLGLGTPALLLLLLRRRPHRPSPDQNPWRRLVAGVVVVVVSAPTVLQGTWSLLPGTTAPAVPLSVVSGLAVLAAYPLMFAGSLRLLNYRRGLVLSRADPWFDGLSSLLALGAVLAAAGVPVLVADGLPLPQAWSTLVRPVVVLVLAAFAVANCQLVGWRTDRRLLEVVAVFGLLLAAEVLDVVAAAGGRGPVTTAVAVGARVAALVLLGVAAWRPAPRPTTTTELGWAALTSPLSVFSMTMVAGFLSSSRPGTAIVTTALTTAALTVVALKVLFLVRTLTGLLESRRLSLVDDLTGLPNRRAFFTEVDRLGGQEVAVMLLDLNGFKHVNDTFGHQLGDELLQDTARRLERVVAGHGTVARLGGDEFVVLLPGADAFAAAQVAQTVHRELGPREVGGRWLVTSASTGIAVGVTGGVTGGRGEDLLHAADVAMYRAKNSGGGWRVASDVLDHEPI